MKGNVSWLWLPVTSSSLMLLFCRWPSEDSKQLWELVIPDSLLPQVISFASTLSLLPPDHFQVIITKFCRNSGNSYFTTSVTEPNQWHGRVSGFNGNYEGLLQGTVEGKTRRCGWITSKTIHIDIFFTYPRQDKTEWRKVVTEAVWVEGFMMMMMMMVVMIMMTMMTLTCYVSVDKC